MIQKKNAKNPRRGTKTDTGRSVARKANTDVQVIQPNPVPTETKSKRFGKVNYPVLSCVLAITVLVIYFFLGYQFMTMAVRENMCNIRMESTPPSGEIVAVIQGQPVYMSEIRDYAAAIPQLAQVPFENVYPQLLQDVVDSKVLKKAAEAAGVIHSPAVQHALALAQDQIIAQAYVDQQLKKRLSDDRLEALYQAELKNFKPVPEVHAKHILVKTEQDAKDIAIQLKAGVPFDSLAAKMSLDKSSPNGDLGYFTEDMMIPEFGRAVFAMKKGQLSDPIHTPFGWHVVLVQDTRMSAPPAFEDVKEDLKQLLMERDAADILAEERSRMQVKIKKPRL